MATVIDIFQGCRNHVHVVVGIDAPRDAQAQQVQSAEAIFTRHGVAVGQDVADFAASDARLKVELAGERLRGKLLFRHVAEHLVGIDEQRMAAHGTLVGNAVFVELRGEVLHLSDARFEHRELGVFVEAHRQRVQVASVHAAVSNKTLEGNAELLCALVPFLVVRGDETAHVHESVFLGRHRHRIHVGIHLARNLLDGFLGISLFARLDEIGVFGKSGRVHHHGHAVFVAERAGFADVLHRNGLSANGVVRHREHHKRHVSLVLDEHFLEFFQRYVALERQLQLRVASLVDGHVDGLRLAKLNVALRRVEMGVARNNVALLHQIREEHVLGSATLMGGNDVLEAEQPLHHLLELEKRRRAGIAFVAEHHGRPLAVAHGACSRVGQAVDIHLVGFQHKHVVMGFAEPLFPLFARTFSKRFHHLDFPRFSKW